MDSDIVFIGINTFNAIRGYEIASFLYNFSVQARYEVGFDDELLDLMKKAGFIELAMGIEFLDDESFKEFHKNSTYSEIVKSIRNIQKHDIGVRGLFIVGADNHKVGVGDKIVDFVLKKTFMEF